MKVLNSAAVPAPSSARSTLAIAPSNTPGRFGMQALIAKVHGFGHAQYLGDNSSACTSCESSNSRTNPAGKDQVAKALARRDSGSR